MWIQLLLPEALEVEYRQVKYYRSYKAIWSNAKWTY